MNQPGVPVPAPSAPCHTDRLIGVLLGTALGDALGLPAEGMNAEQIARRWGRLDHFRLLGQTGFVSDDTEQAALLAECLIRSHADSTDCARQFRRALLGWVARLPFGVGLATLRAGGRIAFGRKPSGVMSAGNGAAMRAAVVGVFFRDEPEQRLSFGTALAETTHLDWRAVEGALLVAELAALCARAQPEEDRRALALTAVRSFPDGPLREASEQALSLADAGVPLDESARSIGTSGYVLHTVPFALYCFVIGPNVPQYALAIAIGAGGDTDSIGAILGGWLGALRGEAGLPDSLIVRIHDGPYGPTHLRALGQALSAVQHGETVSPPGYSCAAALARNLALYPVVLAHGFRRLVPF